MRRGKLPSIKWESTKWVVPEETKVAKPPAPGKTARKGITGVGKASKDGKSASKRSTTRSRARGHLDVFDRAAKSRKPVLIYFTMEECETCLTMEKLLLRQKGVTDASKAFHSVMLIQDYITKDIAKTYKVAKAPTIVLGDYSGRRFVRLRGRQVPDELAKTLNQFAAANKKAVEKAAEKAAREAAREAERKAAREKAGKS